MSFSALAPACDPNSSSSPANGADHSGTPITNHAVFNGNHHPNDSEPANGNAHPNSHAIELNGNTNGNGKPDHVGSRFQYVRATLSSGVSIKGTVKSRSELVIDGHVEGTIESFGRLTVGRNGHVRGDIQTRSVTVHGRVDGNLSVDEQCELRSGCTLRGDIETSRLVVDEDVNFTGSAAIATRDLLSELRPFKQDETSNGERPA